MSIFNQDGSFKGFDPNQVEPAMMGQGQLPVSDSAGYVVYIEGHEERPTKDNTGAYLQLNVITRDMEPKQTGAIRLNLVNNNFTTVEIAKSQLSAICAVCGVNSNTVRPEQLYNIPFRVVVKKQADERYTEVKGVLHVDGSKPGQGKVEANIYGVGTGVGGSVPQMAPPQQMQQHPAQPQTNPSSTPAAPQTGNLPQAVQQANWNQ